MTARGTVLWLLLAAVSAFALFPITYRVKALEEELAGLRGAKRASEQTIHVLNAEWAYLTRPERLAADAVRLLGAGPLLGSQMVAVATVPLRGAVAAVVVGEDAQP
jgi:hypothetical protein